LSISSSNTDGEIVSIDHQNHAIPTIKYQVGNHTYVREFFPHANAVGGKLKIYFDPTEPADAIAAPPRESLYWALVPAVMLTGIFGVAVSVSLGRMLEGKTTFPAPKWRTASPRLFSVLLFIGVLGGIVGQAYAGRLTVVDWTANVMIVIACVGFLATAFVLARGSWREFLGSKFAWLSFALAVMGALLRNSSTKW